MEPTTESGPNEGEGKKLVEIMINGKPYPIDRGRESVVDIKHVGQVPLADELEQVIDGKLTPLPDDGAVVIKGGEVFVSHPRSGGSS